MVGCHDGYFVYLAKCTVFDLGAAKRLIFLLKRYMKPASAPSVRLRPLRPQLQEIDRLRQEFESQARLIEHLRQANEVLEQRRIAELRVFEEQNQRFEEHLRKQEIALRRQQETNEQLQVDLRRKDTKFRRECEGFRQGMDRLSVELQEKEREIDRLKN